MKRLGLWFLWRLCLAAPTCTLWRMERTDGGRGVPLAVFRLWPWRFFFVHDVVLANAASFAEWCEWRVRSPGQVEVLRRANTMHYRLIRDGLRRGNTA